MSAAPSTTTSPAATVSHAEIDASCRGPVVLMFFSALSWLAVSSIFALLTSLKFHKPDLLAHCPIFVFGRVEAVASTTFLYGFAVQAGLATGLWILARLGRVTLQRAGMANLGALFWNLGVTAAFIGLLGGDLTGYEGFEVPRYAGGIFFGALVVIGGCGLATIKQRTQEELYPSQWMLLAALVWLPWILSTAVMLLFLFPLRGVLQAVVHWWYATNLNVVWFGFVGLATVFYLLPKLSNRPLQSRYLAMFIFWTLALFGSWGGIPASAPLPSWMPGVGAMAALLTVVPAVGAAWSCQLTLGPAGAKDDQSGLIRFLVFGVMALLVSTLMNAANSIGEISQYTAHGYFTMAQTKLATYGFFAMVMFAAILHITPRVTGMAWPSKALINLTFWCAALGTLLYVLPLAVGGVQVGRAFNTATLGMDKFQEIISTTINYFRVSTMGDVLMLIAALSLAGSFKLMVYRAARTCCQGAVCGEGRQSARATT